MTHPIQRASIAVAVLALCAGLYACGGSYNGTTTLPALPTVTATPLPIPASNYLATSLVVDAPSTPGYSGEATRQIDAKLINGWGLAFNATGVSWVANNGSDSSTLYDGNGLPQALVVALPAGSHPTGIVFNGSQDFKISAGAVTAASVFIFVGEGGRVFGWAPSVDRTHTVTAAESTVTGAVYKGLAIGNAGGANYLYAADFRNRRIDIYDTTYHKATLPGTFTNPTLPAGLSPFGIQTIGDKVYVSYAKQSASPSEETVGAGLGQVDQFDTSGRFLKTIFTGGVLNAPWGMALAPANFGAVSGMLLVANFGDGKINAFDPVSGALVGALAKADRTPIVIDGLWGIAFGNGFSNQPLNTLYFTAGPGGEAHGAYGRIDLK